MASSEDHRDGFSPSHSLTPEMKFDSSDSNGQDCVAKRKRENSLNSSVEIFVKRSCLDEQSGN